jgi:hypothetical protein
MWRNSPWWGEPEQPDGGEAVGEPPDLGDGMAEQLPGLDMGNVRHPEVDDQQGDGDGEDGIAKEQDPVVLDLPGPG